MRPNAPRIRVDASMQSLQSWFESLAPVRTSRRELWFGLVRTVVVVAVIGSAARMMAIAYWPQWSGPRAAVQELVCPPLPATNPEPLVPPLPLGATTASVASEKPGGLLVSESAWRPPMPTAKREVRRTESKKQPTFIAPPKIVAPPHPAPIALAKRGGERAKKTSTPSVSAPILAQTGNYASPFGDMHGQ